MSPHVAPTRDGGDEVFARRSPDGPYPCPRCVKSSVTNIECNIQSFEAVFMPHMLTADGRRVIEREQVQELLPKPADQKVVSLPKPAA